jgi:hypothetical protein
VGLCLSEILSFLLLLIYYEFKLEILYIDDVRLKEHVLFVSDFFVNLLVYVHMIFSPPKGNISCAY